MDGSSYEDDDLKSKMDGYKISPQMDGSSYEDDNSKSKTGGYKIKSIRRTDHTTRVTI